MRCYTIDVACRAGNVIAKNTMDEASDAFEEQAVCETSPACLCDPDGSYCDCSPDEAGTTCVECKSQLAVAT